jgi:TRAP-type uncharacterized transport system substrate-binding protein
VPAHSRLGSNFGLKCIHRPFAIACLALGLVLALPAGEAAAYRIATYTPGGGPYHNFGENLIAYIRAEGPKDFHLENFVTQGSVQNIQSLYADQDVVLAICQEDVAHFFYTGANNDFFFVDRETDFRITSLGRIFQEEVYLVTRPEIERLDDIQRMYVGESRSGTYATYSSLRSYHDPNWQEIQTGNPLDLFRAGQIDAFIDVRSTPHEELLAFGAEGPGLRVLPVERTELSLGLDVYRPTVVPDSLSPTGEEFRTISVPAVLLARRDLPHEVASLILRVFYDPEVQERWFPESRDLMRAIPTNLRDRDGTPKATDPRFSDLPIPPHPSVVRLTLGVFPYLSFAVALTVLVLIWMAWWQLPRYSSRARRELATSHKQRLLHRDISFLFAAFSWVLACAWGIKYLEIEQLLSGRSISGSDFVNMGAGDLVRWLIVFCTTGYEDRAFPTSPAAKILAVSVQIIGLAFLTWAGARLISYLVSKLMEKREMQNFENLREHVLVCNWNEHGARLLEELRNPRLPQEKLRRKIIVLAAGPGAAIPVHDFENVAHVESDPWDHAALQRVGPERSDSIIILSPDLCRLDADNCDGLVYRTALSLRSYFEGLEGHAGRPHVIAQIAHTMDDSARSALGIDEAVTSHDMGGRLLAQTVTCPGITQFFDEILNCDVDSNEVYSCAMPGALLGKPAKFWAVVTHFLAHAQGGEPVLPVGLRLAVRAREDGKAAAANWPERPSVMLNPTVQELRDIGVTEFLAEDEVLFLADEPHAGRRIAAKEG